MNSQQMSRLRSALTLPAYQSMSEEEYIPAIQSQGGIHLKYEDNDCPRISHQYFSSLAELMRHFNLCDHVKIYSTRDGHIAELERREESITHWNNVGLHHRPGRMNKHDMSIIMVLGFKWVEWGVKTITVGL